MFPQSDETEYVEAVVNAGGLTPHYIRADQLSPLYDLEHVLQIIDEPRIWTEFLY